MLIATLLVAFCSSPKPTSLKPAPAQKYVALSDPKATPQAKALFRFLQSEQGMGTLSGQYTGRDCRFTKKLTGKLPAIRGGDFMEYSLSRLARGSNPHHEVTRMIAAGKRGQIITMSWHWNAPDHLINKMITDSNGRQINALWYKGFYTNASTFNLKTVLDHPSSHDYQLLVADLDHTAGLLKRFATAHIPILWRPLHEAEGGWFWWGAQGPQPCIKLYLLERQIFINQYHLHNLVWVWNSLSRKWYPGDKNVDVIAADLYPGNKDSLCASAWARLKKNFPNKHVFAIGEFGGVPDIPAMRAAGEHWAYFVSWSGGNGPRGMPANVVRKIYQSPNVVNANALPKAIFGG